MESAGKGLLLIDGHDGRGVGPGVIPPILEKKGTRVFSMEIDPVVLETARKWFDFTGDAVVDAFLGGSPPWPQPSMAAVHRRGLCAVLAPIPQFSSRASRIYATGMS
jgi:hypothetical protein